MRLPHATVLFILSVLCGTVMADEPAWRTQPLPPEVATLNRTAESAATAATAARIYAQSLRLFPSNGPALYGLGRALLDQGRASDALVILRRMNTQFPDDPVVLEALASAITRLPSLRRENLAEGLAFVEQALRLQPDAPNAWHVLSVLRHLNGDYVLAFEAAQEAVALDAQNPTDPETTTLYQEQEIACNDALLVFSPLD